MSVAVRIHCPHCRSLCQVDESHIGSTVKCGRCAKLFAIRIPAPVPPPLAPPPRPTQTESADEMLLDLEEPGDEAAIASATSPPRLSSSLPLGLGCLDIGAATSPGQIRMRNEDSFLVQHMSWSNLDERHEIALAVVADGLGGHEAGDKASGLAIRRIGASLLPLFAEVLNHPQVILPESRLADAVCQAIKEANRLIHRQANEHNDYRGMGATVAVVLIVDSQAVIGHVGDCRVYHQSGEEVTQVTRDQTLVARMVELGQLSEAEALTHPSRHEVIHALGRHADIASAIYDVKLATGDWIVVASDGLHTHLGREALQGAIGNAAPSAIALAHHLVALAEQGGGTDNCTVVAVRSC